MNRGENLDFIPTDLFLEIFSRLPAKSIGRFRCLSKLWRSMLSRQDFTELFLTRSSARPRLLFGIQQNGKWFFFSSPQPQPQHQYEKSYLVVAADFHTKLHGEMHREEICSYASGLIYFSDMWISKKTVSVICNPITGQYAILPILRIDIFSDRSFIGFDPIDKQFKVLLMASLCYPAILTLGTGKMRWRKIQSPLIHEPFGEGICINGVLYYSARCFFGRSDHVIVCFDVRSEKFKFADSPSVYTKLINYKGKLCGIKLTKGDDVDDIELCMWVLEDVEKQEWSKYVYPLPENEFVYSCDLSVVGVTATDEIVLSKRNACKPFYVFYFNPERNTLLNVEIQGVVVKGQEWFNHRLYIFQDHVEDLNFNIMKTTYAATSSISPPEQRRKPTAFESANKFDVLSLLDDDTLSGKDHHQVRTSASSGKDHQVGTVAHPKQDRRTFENVTKFISLRHFQVSCCLIVLFSVAIMFMS